MTNNANQHNSRFADGVLLGILLGGAAVFLLGTKKGNRILKILTEQGLEGFSEIAKEIENEAKKETKVQLKKVEDKIEDFGESIVVLDPVVEAQKSSAKRFFRKPSAKN